MSTMSWVYMLCQRRKLQVVYNGNLFAKQVIVVLNVVLICCFYVMSLSSLCCSFRNVFYDVTQTVCPARLLASCSCRPS